MSTSPKIKVLIIPSWYPPDGGWFFKEHSEMLISEEFDISILVTRIIGLSSHRFKDIVTSWFNRERYENKVLVSRTSMIKLPWTERLNMFRWINKSMRHFENFCRNHWKPDIIIVHSVLWAGLLAERIKREYSIPFILVEHRGRFIGNNIHASSFLKYWYSDIISRAFNSANHIVCVSESLKEGIQKLAKLSESNLSVIPNIIDSDFFYIPKYKKEKQPFIILSIGMLEKVKGFDTLLQAFASLTDNLEGEFFLRIGGKGSQEKSLRILASDLGISDRVSFLGRISRERVRDEMQRSNIFVLASRFESFGIVLIEAAMTGLPLIATKSGGPQTIIKAGNGILIEPEDIEALEKAMENLYFHYLNYNPEWIRQDAVSKFNRGAIIPHYHKLIRDILNA